MPTSGSSTSNEQPPDLMWYPPFRFALRSQLRRPLLWMLAVGLALAGACLLGTIRSQILADFGATTLSAPRIVAVVIAGLSALSLLVLASPLADLVLRDFDTGMAQLVFSSPVNPRQYLAGRMMAGIIIYLVVMCVAGVGVFAGLAFTGDLHLWTAVCAVLWSLGCVVLPNACFMVAALVAVASRARTIGWVYAGILVFYVLWALPLEMVGTTPAMRELLITLLDPFGSHVLSQLPVLLADSVDTKLPRLSGYFLVNRVMWLLTSVILAAWAIGGFRVSRLSSAARAPVRGASAPDRAPQSAPAMLLECGRHSAWTQVRALFHRGLGWTVRSTLFKVMLALGVMLLLGMTLQASGLYGTQSEFTMAWMLQALNDSVRLPLTFMLAVFAGSLVFRARETRMHGIEGSLPVSPVYRLLTDDLILIAMVLMVHAVLVAVAIGLQCTSAAITIEPWIYVEWLVRSTTSFTLLALLARALFGLCAHRALGFALFAGIAIVARLGVMRYPEYGWVAFAAPPTLGYSDLAGFFISAGTCLTIALTWTAALAALQAGVVIIRPSPPRSLTAHPVAALTMVGGLIGALAGGIFLYQATALGFAEYSENNRSDQAARYARAYAKYAQVPQLRVRALHADVDFYPSEGRVEVRGTYSLLNTRSVPVDTLYVNWEPRDAATLVLAQPARTMLDDPELGFRIVKLDTPVPPGAALEVGFTATIANDGDDPSGTEPVIDKDGAMFSNQEHFPQFGYLQRKARAPGTTPVTTLPAARTADTTNTQIEGQADWIDFSATVSTQADQTALTSGILERQWRIGERHYGLFRMHSKMLPYFAFASGRYELARSTAGAVPIEVYYDARHAANVAQVLATARDSLNWFGQQLGSYPFGVLRMVEVAATVNGVQAFPGMVAISESSEFTRDLDAGRVHSLQFMLAHEMAHQWFAHQTIGANAPGANMLTESVAQYLALIELERTAGRPVALDAVRWDLDVYLKTRPRGLGLERALSAEDGEAYLYYHKGAVAFWLLAQDLGEPVVTEVLARFLADHRFKTAPYPTAVELVSRLHAVASDIEGARIDELLSGIAPNERYAQAAIDGAVHSAADYPYDLQRRSNVASNQSRRDAVASTNHLAHDRAAAQIIQPMRVPSVGSR